MANPCATNADCQNTVGSFQCNCRTGFAGNGFTCTSKVIHIICFQNVVLVLRKYSISWIIICIDNHGLLECDTTAWYMIYNMWPCTKLLGDLKSLGDLINMLSATDLNVWYSRWHDVKMASKCSVLSLKLYYLI